MTYFGHRIAPEQPLEGVGDTSELEAKNVKRSALPPFQEKCGYIIFILVPFVLTQVMQNRAVMAIFQPIAILACKSMGVSCVGPVLLVSAACCAAFMTPSATACIPMIMGG